MATPSSSSSRVIAARSMPPRRPRLSSAGASAIPSPDPHGRPAVVAVRRERLGRQRIHGARGDQRLDVVHVGVARVLGAGGGPERPLRTGPGLGEPVPPRACPATTRTAGRPRTRWRWRSCREAARIARRRRAADRPCRPPGSRRSSPPTRWPERQAVRPGGAPARPGTHRSLRHTARPRTAV